MYSIWCGDGKETSFCCLEILLNQLLDSQHCNFVVGCGNLRHSVGGSKSCRLHLLVESMGIDSVVGVSDMLFTCSLV